MTEQRAPYAANRPARLRLSYVGPSGAVDAESLALTPAEAARRHPALFLALYREMAREAAKLEARQLAVPLEAASRRAGAGAVAAGAGRRGTGGVDDSGEWG